MPPSRSPGFAETVAGLKGGLANLGLHLAGAAGQIAANLLKPLSSLRKSAEEGDEDAERAYAEVLALLRSSGSDTADELLKQLGEGEVASAAGRERGAGGEEGEGELAGIELEAAAEVEVASAPRVHEAEPSPQPAKTEGAAAGASPQPQTRARERDASREQPRTRARRPKEETPAHQVRSGAKSSKAEPRGEQARTRTKTAKRGAKELPLKTTKPKKASAKDTSHAQPRSRTSR